MVGPHYQIDHQLSVKYLLLRKLFIAEMKFQKSYNLTSLWFQRQDEVVCANQKGSEDKSGKYVCVYTHSNVYAT